ncbi:hypothetical protein SBY92_002637 [Candida maltosa Xu316]
MSAFMLVSTQASANFTNNKKNRKKKSKTSASASTRSSGSSTRNTVASTTISSVTESIQRKKQVYDINLDRYVDYEPTPFELSLAEYEKTIESLKTSVYYPRNVSLNDDTKSIFHLKIIEMLRHTYFEDVKYDSVVSFKLNQKNANGKYKLNYMRKIADLTESTTLENSLPGLSLNEEDDEEGDEEYGNGKISVRKQLDSVQFWNNVYQDIRFESQQASFNYFEYLPTMNQAIKFYKELIDYFLYNLHVLKAKTEGVTDPEEIIQLQQSHFIYFTEFNYEYFKIMKMEHDKMYHNCESTKDRFIIYQKLITVIISNLKRSFTVNQEHALSMWEQFFQFIFLDILSQQQHQQNNNNKKYDSLMLLQSSSALPPATSFSTPPRKLSISSKMSHHSMLSMGKSERTGSVCTAGSAFGERSPIDSSIDEFPQKEQIAKPKKMSIFKRLTRNK